MAVIPPDAGVQLRLQTNAGPLQPAAPVQEVSADLTDLRAGQQFTARIQEVLPENTYRALVAGKQLTLQLPEGATAGDTLELVVVDRTPRVVIARVAEQPGTSAAAEPYKYSTLSQAGQMIGELLLKDGEPPRPASLNRGEPLLPQPPKTAAELVPVLQKAVAESGLFYESHQAQWVDGKRPIEQLLQEPQGRHSAPATLARHAAPEAERDAGQAASPPNARVAQEPPAREAARSESGTQQQQGTALGTMPDALRPIVQQQLDAVATQRLLWHGEAWPNQPLEWEIVRDQEQGSAASADEEMSWRSTLRLDTPRLGHVEASLRLTGAGIQMTLAAPADGTVSDLQKGLPELMASLQAAGIPLLSFQVRHEPD